MNINSFSFVDTKFTVFIPLSALCLSKFLNGKQCFQWKFACCLTQMLGRYWKAYGTVENCSALYNVLIRACTLNRIIERWLFQVHGSRPATTRKLRKLCSPRSPREYTCIQIYHNLSVLPVIMNYDANVICSRATG